MHALNYFPNLTKVDASNNQVTYINVLDNFALEELDVRNNQLTSIDLSKNTFLKHLYLDNNKLGMLDLTNNFRLDQDVSFSNQKKTVILPVDDDSRLIPLNQLADYLDFDSNMVTDLTGATIGQFGRIKVNEGVTEVTYNYKTGLGAVGHELKMPVTLEINQGYTVSFNVGDYGYRVPNQKVAEGGTAREPADPTDLYPTDPAEKDWEFKGWYTDNTFATAFDFTAPINADVTVYVKGKRLVVSPLRSLPQSLVSSPPRSLLR
ncbi:InlB B-repeat-containing protein [Actinotignum schaalii]|nr:InlB B-repeat-containing protein [Actinotignum sanguinis]MDE1654372.1 InlB B-repeat-containing protein [Actinotignum schaalii]MDK8342489.1 InlB B-repeat-containing protein [Winkia sp. UMB3164B]MDK8609334.1 InlB B-repeat-containing protein [Actinomycetaceae bacterium UMB8041A]